MMTAHILIIYTGGTIGSVEDPETKSLRPLDFEQLKRQIPELDRLQASVEVETMDPMDSSDIGPKHWVELAELLYERREYFDGFVVLHGTDTMAYTASALSFMLLDFAKPVVLTGSQLPIGVLRTDGKENFLTAVEIAAHRTPDPKTGEDFPTLQEVAVYFGDDLFRGNRTHKHSAEDFHAIGSSNYPALAEVGVNLRFRSEALLRPTSPANLATQLDPGVLVVHLVPGLNSDALAHLFNTPGLRAVVLRTFGSGNAPSSQDFVSVIHAAVQRGLVVVNVSQCTTGSVDPERYATGRSLSAAGVIPALDMTLESAVTKLMVLGGQHATSEAIASAFRHNIAGEQTDHGKLL